MKKYIIATSFLLLLLIATPVLANDSDSNYEKRSYRRQEVKENIKERVTAREDKREEFIEKLSQRRKEILSNYFSKMVKRLEAAVERLEKLITRLEARIAKIKEENSNLNLSSQELQLTKAKEKLALVKVDLATLKTQFTALTTSENPKEDFETFRSQSKKVKEGLKEVHRMLVKIIGEVKGLRVGEGKK